MKAKFFPYLIFILLLLISFKNVLTTPGIVGHTWDWGIPNFTEQFFDKAKDNFYVWDDWFETGRYHYFKLELYYWLVLLPFSLLGGEFVSKVFPMALLLLAGCTMYWLVRNIFKFNRFFAAISGIFYMLSPVTYSKIVAGHLPLLFGYALLPLLIISLLRIFESLKGSGSLSFKYIVLGGAVLGLESLHPSVGTCSLIIASIFFLVNLFQIEQKKKLLYGFAVMAVIAILLNLFWIVPFVKDYAFTGALRHGWGLSVSQEKEVTVKSEMPLREEYLRSTSQPVHSVILLKLRTGMDTEYVYPSPLPNLWIISSITLALLSFASLLITRKKDILPFVIIGFVGITLVSGVKTPVGKIIYQVIFKHFLPMFYAAFSSPNRWLPLIVAAYAVLAPYSLNQLSEKLNGRKSVILKTLSAALILVFVSPFISGRLTEPLTKGITQPHSLKVTNINKEDRKVYDFFKRDEDIYRVAYLPPASLSWPGETDLSYEWSMAYSPKPTFLGWHNHPFGYSIISNLYSSNPSPFLGKLVGLASVKYIIYPHYDFFVSYKDFIPAMTSAIKVEGFKNYKPLIDRNLKMMRDIVPLESGFKTVTVFENNAFLPQIYPASTTIVAGKIDSLVSLTETSYLERYPALAFADQQNENSLQTIIWSRHSAVNGQVLFANSNFHDLLIDLIKAEGKSNNQQSAVNNQEPILTKLNKNANGSFKVKESNLYDVYIESSKLKVKDLDLKVEVDTEELKSWNWEHEKNNKWIKVGEVRLDKGEHKIAVGSQRLKANSQYKEKFMSQLQGMDIIIVSKKRLNEYRNIISQRSISHLFYIDTEKIEGVLKDEEKLKEIKLKKDNPFRIGKQEFYIPRDGNYSVKALVKPRRDFLISDFVSSSSSSRLVLEAISGWDVKTLYAEYKKNILENGVYIDAYFQYQGDKKEAVILTKKFSDISIKERPYLAFSSEMEDLRVQEVEIVVNFIDRSSWFFKNKKLILKAENRQYVVNVYDKAKAVFGTEMVKDLQMDEVALRFKKRDGVDVSNEENKRYRFIFKNIAFLKTQPILAMFDDEMNSDYLPDIYYYFDKNGDLKNVDFSEQISWDIKNVYKLHIKRFIDLKEMPVLSLSLSKPEIASSQRSAASINEGLRDFPNEWKVIMGLDLDGDEKEDERIELLVPAAGLIDGKLLLNVKAYDEIKKRFPNKMYYNLLSIGVSYPDDKEIFYQAVMSKKLIRYRERVYESSDFKAGAGILEVDGKMYKMANGKWLKDKGDSGNWVEFRNVYLKKGEHDLNVLENDKFKVEMVEIKPEAKGERREAIGEKPKIEFKKINPTRYIVDVKEAKDPFTLVFSESFHEGWKAYIRLKARGERQKARNEEPWSAIWSLWKDRDDRIEIKDHFLVNGYANGWIVQAGQKAKGEGQRAEEEGFQIVLEFKPQRLFELGLLISATTLIGCIGYLGYGWMRRKKSP